MAKSYRGLLKQLADLPPETRTYLSKLERLLNGSKDYDIALAYLFMKIEEANHRALKCGLVRLLKCDSAKSDEALAQQHFTRNYFKEVFNNVIGKPVPKAASDALMRAENVRDQQIHGKKVPDALLRDAISDGLSYVQKLGEFVHKRTGKNPCGDLRGLKGRATLLDTTASYWILKGIGLFTGK